MQATVRDGASETEGHGRRLLRAFAALEALPVLQEARDSLLAAVDGHGTRTADVVSAVESDVALLADVLRQANSAQPGRGQVDTAVGAVGVLAPEALRELATGARTFGFFEHSATWGSVPQRFRLHALATQRAADRIAAEVGYAHRDRLAATSLLHDVGKLVLIHAYPSYPAGVRAEAGTPAQRIQRERRELGVEHALVGGVLVRRWGLPTTLASPIECHHVAEDETEAALIRLADMLAHYEQGARLSSSEILDSARAVGLGRERLRAIMYELPGAGGKRPGAVDPCPLTNREVEVLRRLALGGVYKQIAFDLSLSMSTVRSHLHNIYRKLGAVDRAQAVLIATRSAWI